MLFFTSCLTQNHDTLLYLNQPPPGLTPVIFAPGIISLTDRSEFGSVFSKDGKEFYFGIDIGGRSEIRYSILENGKWSPPGVLLSDTVSSFNDPFLSPSENELYFITNRTLDGLGNKNDHDIYFIRKNRGQWIPNPVRVTDEINSSKDEYYMSFTSDGTMYFSSNVSADSARGHDFDIYASKVNEGQYQKALKLPANINSRAYEADVFIATDESYIIYCSARRTGYGRGDLYISFKSATGEWSTSKNMGDNINTAGHELCPFVSRDEKYFFYTSNQDIYWVDASVLEQYR